jgi:hypothetical protein
MPRALRSAAIALVDVRASLDATLNVRAQSLSLFGRLRPVDPGLLWIVKLGAGRLGGGKGMACALADHMSLVLGSGGKHVKR